MDFLFRDKNGKLDRDEFGAYLHPSSHPESMSEVMALETIEELDKDKDGYLDLDEYLGDAKNIPNEDAESDISDDFIGTDFKKTNFGTFSHFICS